MISRLIAFILAFTFTIPTLPNNYSVVSSAYACPEGQEPHPERKGECVPTAETIQTSQAAAACEEIEDATDKQACYLDVAKNEDDNGDVMNLDGDSIGEDYNTGFLAGDRWNTVKRQAPLQVINGAVLMYMIKRKVLGATETCVSVSLKLMLGAGAATALGEVIANVKYRKKMRDIVRAYKETSEANSQSDTTTTTTTPTTYGDSSTEDPQIAAFNFLIDQEKERKSAAQVRGGFYAAAGALYAAAAIAAGVEMTLVANPATAVAANATQTCVNPVQIAAGTTSDAASATLKATRVGVSAGEAVGATTIIGTTGAAAGAAIPALSDTEADSDNEGSGSVEAEETEPTSNELYQSLPPSIYDNASYEMNKTNKNNERIEKVESIEEIVAEFKRGLIDHAAYDLAANAGFHYGFSQANAAEVNEITLRTIFNAFGEGVMNFIIPSAHASCDSNSQASTGSMDKSENFIDECEGGVMGDIFSELWRMLVPLGVGAILGAIPGVWNATLARPLGRITAAGVLGAWSGVISYKSFKAAANASERIAALEEVRDNYVNTGGSNLDPCESRDDPSKPSCYCYDEQGEKNYARANSQVCLNKWGEGGVIQPTDYTQMAGGSSGPKGCVTNDGQYDSVCSCRYAKDRNKKCQTVSSSMNFGGLGNNAWMQAAAGQANALTNGTMSGADVAAGTMNNTAMRAKKMLDKLIKKHPHLKGTDKKLKKFKSKLAAVNTKLLRRAAASAKSSPATSSLASIKSPADALKAAKESLKKESTLKFSGGAGGQKAAGQKEDGMDFDFGMGEVTPGMDPTQLADAMDKEYDFKGDIHNNPDNNIFDILTLRYQRSGLRRLFDDKGSTIADEPSKTDINKK